MAPNRPPRARNRLERTGIESPGRYGSTHCHPNPWRLFGKPVRPHFLPKFANFMVKSYQNWGMLGCRSRHIGQLRPNPLPECFRSRRVSMEDFNLTPIGGRNDKNRQGPLGKPVKLGKSDMTPKWAGPYGPGPGHLKFLVNIVATCSSLLQQQKSILLQKMFIQISNARWLLFKATAHVH